MQSSERVAREREFHNLRFADDSERDERVGRFYAAIGYGFQQYRERVAAASRGRTVLEYGCGNGTFGFDLAATAREVIGIDISDVAIRQANLTARTRGITNVRFLVDNAEAMSLPDQSVDVVAGTGIVHHLDIERAMQEIRRVLRPGGLAIFAEPLGHNPALNWYRRRTPELRTADEHPLLRRDLRAMACGFAASRVTYFGLVAPLLGLVSKHTSQQQRTTRAMWWLDRTLCRAYALNRYAWYCIAELHT